MPTGLISNTALSGECRYSGQSSTPKVHNLQSIKNRSFECEKRRHFESSYAMPHNFGRLLPVTSMGKIVRRVPLKALLL